MLPEKIFSATTLLEGNLTFLNDAKLLILENIPREKKSGENLMIE